MPIWKIEEEEKALENFETSSLSNLRGRGGTHK